LKPPALFQAIVLRVRQLLFTIQYLYSLLKPEVEAFLIQSQNIVHSIHRAYERFLDKWEDVLKPKLKSAWNRVRTSVIGTWKEIQKRWQIVQPKLQAEMDAVLSIIIRIWREIYDDFLDFWVRAILSAYRDFQGVYFNPHEKSTAPLLTEDEYLIHSIFPIAWCIGLCGAVLSNTGLSLVEGFIKISRIGIHFSEYKNIFHLKYRRNPIQYAIGFLFGTLPGVLLGCCMTLFLFTVKGLTAIAVNGIKPMYRMLSATFRNLSNHQVWGDFWYTFKHQAFKLVRNPWKIPGFLGGIILSIMMIFAHRLLIQFPENILRYSWHAFKNIYHYSSAVIYNLYNGSPQASCDTRNWHIFFSIPGICLAIPVGVIILLKSLLRFGYIESSASFIEYTKAILNITTSREIYHLIFEHNKTGESELPCYIIEKKEKRRNKFGFLGIVAAIILVGIPCLIGRVVYHTTAYIGRFLAAPGILMWRMGKYAHDRYTHRLRFDGINENPDIVILNMRHLYGQLTPQGDFKKGSTSTSPATTQAHYASPIYTQGTQNRILRTLYKMATFNQCTHTEALLFDMLDRYKKSQNKEPNTLLQALNEKTKALIKTTMAIPRYHPNGADSEKKLIINNILEAYQYIGHSLKLEIDVQVILSQVGLKSFSMKPNTDGSYHPIERNMDALFQGLPSVYG
jgi:hypothetical protein